MNKTILITVIIVILLGALVYFATTNNDLTENETDTTQETTLNENTSIIGDNDGNENDTPNLVNTVVLAPTETGNSVEVDTAILTKPGFVVVYQVNSNSETEIIGNSDLLLPGTYDNLTIQLDTVIAEEQTVVAVLHEDDGDGEFEFPDSDFYLGNTGQLVVSDVDVVDVPSQQEDAILQNQVETYLEANLETDTTMEVN